MGVKGKLSAFASNLSNSITGLFTAPAGEGIESQKDLIYEYGQALIHIPQLLQRLAFRTRTLEAELQEAMLRGNLRRSLSFFDLLMLGLGIVVGGSIFTLAGKGLALFAGSAIVLSVLFIGVACMCAAACYGELCMEYPVAGSAFTYVMVTFGELPAFITMGMLLLEYVLGMAAVASGFSRYLAVLFGLTAKYFVVDPSGAHLDVMAFGIVLVLTLVLTVGVRETSAFIDIMTMVKLILMVVICIVAFANSEASIFSENFTLPETGPDGVFQAGALLLFSFSAFDAVTVAVEEAQRIETIPWALLGTVGISGLLYALLAVGLALMDTPDELMNCIGGQGHLLLEAPLTSDTCPELTSQCLALHGDQAYNIAFVVAFKKQGVSWMRRIVPLASLFGIITSLLVGLFTAARLVMVAARAWLLPPFLATVSKRTLTPVIAQLILGVIIAILALELGYTQLTEMVNFGTLFGMWAVCNTLLYRRYYPDIKFTFTQFGTIETKTQSEEPVWHVPGARLPMRMRRWLSLIHIILLNSVCIAFAMYYRLTTHAEKSCRADLSGGTPLLGRHDSSNVVAFIASWLGLTLSMLLLCPIHHHPDTWAISRWLLPWLPSVAILFTCFSAASLNHKTYIYVGIYFAILLAVYVLFSMPMSYIRHFKLDNDPEENRVVEIVYQDGKWQSVEGMSTLTSPVTLGTSKDGYSGLWSTPSRLHSRLHSSLGLSNLGSTFSGIRPLPEPGMSTPTLTYSRKFDVSEI